MSNEEQDKCASSTSLGENEKKLLEDLGKELGMKLENRDKLTYSQSTPSYYCSKKAHPLSALKDFCYENKYKVKLENLNRSGNLSVEDLKSKLSDYISSQPLEELELVKKKLSSSNSSGICEDLIDLNKNCSDAEMLAKIKRADHYEERLKWWRDEVCPGNKSIESIINLLLATDHNKKKLTLECLKKVDIERLDHILKDSKNYVKRNLEKLTLIRKGL